MARNREPGAGHNEAGLNAATLKGFVQEIETLITQRRGLNETITEICAKAKHLGYDAKTLRRIVRDKMRNKQEVEAERETQKIYEDLLDDSGL